MRTFEIVSLVIIGAILIELLFGIISDGNTNLGVCSIILLIITLVLIERVRK